MNRKNKFVSVIMSVFNDELFIGEAIESILSQTMQNFEFLITDDSSQDRSAEIIQSYAKQDKRIRFFPQIRNRGLTKNLNFLLSKTTTELIARMDADDISHPNRLELQYDFITKNNFDIIWTNCTYIDEHGDFICNRYQPSVRTVLHTLRIKNCIIHPSVMFRKEALIKTSFYNENFKAGQDLDLWIRLKAENAKFGYLNIPLINYRIRAKGITRQRKGFSSDTAFDHAKTCIRNNQPLRALYFVNRIRSVKRRALIVVRLLIPYWLVISGRIVLAFFINVRHPENRQ